MVSQHSLTGRVEEAHQQMITTTNPERLLLAALPPASSTHAAGRRALTRPTPSPGNRGADRGVGSPPATFQDLQAEVEG